MFPLTSYRRNKSAPEQCHYDLSLEARRLSPFHSVKWMHVDKISSQDLCMWSYMNFLMHFFFLCSYWLTNKVHIKRPSTGLLMYTLATRFCDEIHLYGFWPFPKDLHGKPVKYHYYDDLKYRYFSNASPHRMPLEFKTLYVLHNRGALKLTAGKCIQQ